MNSTNYFTDFCVPFEIPSFDGCVILMKMLCCIRQISRLTDAVGLHVALPRHAVSPQALMGEAAGQTVLHPVVCGRGDHQQDVPHNGTKQAPSHEAVHHE